jgi:hypothetical protein
MGCTLLPTLSMYVLPCSNSALKGNNGTNRILYHDTAAQNLLHVSLLEPRILDSRRPWVFSKHKLFLI